MDISKINSLIEFTDNFFSESVDYRNYKALNEKEKIELGKGIFERIYKKVKAKSIDIDYSLVETSQGIITNFKDYQLLVDILSHLNTLYKKNPKAPVEIKIIETALTNLKINSREFNLGFKNDSDIIKMIYNNVVIAIIEGLALLIAESVEYVQNPNGTIDMEFTNNKKLNKIFLKNLESFNKLVMTGRLRIIFKHFINVDSFDGGIVVTTTIVITALTLTVWIIRELVYVFYKSRVVLSETLRDLADTLNQTRQLKDVSSKSSEKQKKIIDKLNAWADKIDVTYKSIERNLENDIKKDDSDIKVNSQGNNMDVIF